jgi:hypothetical protein
MKAVEVIMEHEVPEDRIIFINLVRALSLYLRSIFRHDRFGRAQVSAPEGLKTFTSRYPLVKVVGPFSPVLVSLGNVFFFRLLGGLTTVSMSELISSPDWVTLASGGTPMFVMDIRDLPTPSRYCA